MTDVPDALVEKAAEALCVNAERRADQDITRRERDTARKIARAVLATVWEDSGLSLAFEQHATAIRAAARPVVNRGALADEVAARIEGSQSPLRDVPQADMAYERAAQDARDAIHASENVQDAADLAEMLRAEAHRIAPPYKRTVGATERSIALYRAAHFIEHGSWPEGDDAEFTDTLPTPDTASWSAPVQDAADVRRAVAEAAILAAADEMEAVIAEGDVAEVAAPVSGEVNRSKVVAKRDALYEEPAKWLRDNAAPLARATEATP